MQHEAPAQRFSWQQVGLVSPPRSLFLPLPFPSPVRLSRSKVCSLQPPAAERLSPSSDERGWVERQSHSVSQPLTCSNELDQSDGETRRSQLEGDELSHADLVPPTTMRGEFHLIRELPSLLLDRTCCSACDFPPSRNVGSRRRLAKGGSSTISFVITDVIKVRGSYLPGPRGRPLPA